MAPLAEAADTIATDRPDFVESSDVVGVGRWQIEAGLSNERDRAEGLKTRVRSTPLLLRVGISDTLELRLETDGRINARAHDPATGTTLRERGTADTALGLKWRMQEGDEARGTPGVAWLLHLDLDSGSRAFRGQGVRPSLRGVAEWALPNDFSVGVMPGLMVDRQADGRRFVAGILALTLGKSWTAQWRSFIELAGQQIASQRHGGSVVTLDAGVTYLVTDTLQLDLAVSRGLSRAASDFQWGGGLSARF